MMHNQPSIFMQACIVAEGEGGSEGERERERDLDPEPVFEPLDWWIATPSDSKTFLVCPMA